MILHLKNCAAKGVAVFHNWSGAHFYPLFIKAGHLPNLVVDFRFIEPYFISEPQIRCNTFKGFQNFQTLAFEFDFMKVDPLGVNLSRLHCLKAGCICCR